MLNTDTWGDTPTAGKDQPERSYTPHALRTFAVMRSQAREAAVRVMELQKRQAETAQWAAKFEASIGDARGPEYDKAFLALEAAQSSLVEVTSTWERMKEKLRKREEASALQLEGLALEDLEKASDKPRPPTADVDAMRAIVAEFDRRRQAEAARVAIRRREVAFLATRGMHARANEIADSVMQALESAVAAYEEMRRIEELIIDRGGTSLSRLSSVRFQAIKEYCALTRAESADWPARGTK